MKIKNKWLLAIGTPIVAVSPVIAVVSCGSSSSMKSNENVITQEEKDAYKAELSAWKDDWSNFAWSGSAIQQKYVDDQAFFNADLRTVKGKNTNKSFYLPRFIESIGDGAFQNAKLPGDFKLVDANEASTGYKNWRGVKSLGSEAFKGVDFTTILADHADLIPDSVWSIDGSCFNSSILPEGFKVKNSVIEMGTDVFAGAKIPVNFTFNPDMSDLADGAFAGATFKGDLTLPAKMHVIGSRAFQNVDFTGKTFKMSDEVYKIKSEAFEGATFSEKFVVTDTVQEMQESAFSHAILNGGIQIGTSQSRLSEFTNNVFNGVTVLTTFDLSNAHSIAKIDEKAFMTAKITSDFTIPTSVKSIGQMAFAEVDFTVLSPEKAGTILYIGDGATYSIERLSPSSFQNTKLPNGFRLWGPKSGISSADLGSAFQGAIFEPGRDWSEKDTTGPLPGAKVQ